MQVANTEGAAAVDDSDPIAFAPLHRGEAYLRVLRRLHEGFAPRNYLEVGVHHGSSLELSRVPSLAVDPRPKLPEGFLEARPHVRVFPETSDAFFAAHDPAALLGAPVDLAFLDGLHTAKALLRDFMNTERCAAPGSVIALHDCLPTDLGMARADLNGPSPRTRRRNFWSGDVWKVLPILRRHRPDLTLCVLDAPPSGLVLVSGLDPQSRVLEAGWDAIVAEIDALDLGAIGVSAFLEGQAIRPTRSVGRRRDLAPRGWLHGIGARIRGALGR